MTPDDFNRLKVQEAWHLLCNIPFVPPTTTILPSIESLRLSEWSVEFEDIMRDRLVMGAFRYGLLHAKGKPKWDRMASIRTRLDMYEESGDIGLLADVANLCLLEFEEGQHPKRHLAKGDGDHHVTVKE